MRGDGREGGFIKVHRQVNSWPLWKAMTANQRMVWIQILMLANWKDDSFWYGTHRIEIKRGQLSHSEGTIAKAAKVGRKVVRDTIERLLAEGAIGREKAQVEGQAPFIITVRNYDKYQSFEETEGQGEGQARAKRGPGWGQGGALREEGEEGKKEKNLPLLAPVGASPRTRRKAQDADPRHSLFVRQAFDDYADIKGSAKEFIFDGRDGKRLHDLLRQFPTLSADQFSLRWRMALKLKTYPGCARIAHLVDRWNELAPVNGHAKTGDLGTELSPWWSRLSSAQRAEYLKQREAVDPELSLDAPFGLTGTAHTAEVAALNERWARLADARGTA